MSGSLLFTPNVLLEVFAIMDVYQVQQYSALSNPHRRAKHRKDVRAITTI